jgi:hypothetical protein
MSLLAESILASLIDLVIRVQKLVLLELDDAPLCSILTDDRSGVKNGWLISSREILSYVRDCILLVVVGGVKNSVFIISASTSFTTCLFLNYWAGFLAFIDNIIGINRKRWGLPLSVEISQRHQLHNDKVWVVAERIVKTSKKVLVLPIYLLCHSLTSPSSTVPIMG